MVCLIKWSDHLKTGQKKCLKCQMFGFQVFRWLLYLLYVTWYPFPSSSDDTRYLSEVQRLRLRLNLRSLVYGRGRGLSGFPGKLRSGKIDSEMKDLASACRTLLTRPKLQINSKTFLVRKRGSFIRLWWPSGLRQQSSRVMFFYYLVL